MLSVVPASLGVTVNVRVRQRTRFSQGFLFLSCTPDGSDTLLFQLIQLAYKVWPLLAAYVTEIKSVIGCFL